MIKTAGSITLPAVFLCGDGPAWSTYRTIHMVVLMPPTLIASIYGMNFKLMPELEWTHGYPMALIMMLFAAVLPYVLFKWKRWL